MQSEPECTIKLKSAVCDIAPQKQYISKSPLPRSSDLAATHPLNTLEKALPTQTFDATSIRRPISSFLAIELCCGAAGLSAAIRRLGMDTIGVDYIRNPSTPQAPIIKLYLSSKEGRQIIKDMLKEVNVAYIHAAVPCGTT